MERAVAYEIKRQTKVLERGEKVIQETRGWDEGTQATFAQRTKEGSADYRYFPDPDLPSLKLSEISEFAPDALRANMPELPEARRQRYLSLGIKREDTESFVGSPLLGSFFDEVVSSYGSDSTRTTLAANYIANDLVSRIRDSGIRDAEEIAEIPISARNFKQIVDMLAEKRLSSRAAKDILAEAINTKGEPARIAKEKGLFQADQEGSTEKIIDDVMSKNEASVADFRSGKAAALEYIVGQCMRALRGAVDPVALRDRIRAKITE
jgi:aspartyl-tRNA(Asn)/glutamyl-tRNA(Gln) amidotransferase subunit B